MAAQMQLERNVATAIRFIRALETGATEDLAEYYAQSVVQEEFPNRLLPNGARRDFSALIEASKRGRSAVANQRFEIVGVCGMGSQVAMELIWSGSVTARLGSLHEGAVMRARFAIFLDFENGKIIRQRNYDCFDPF